MPKTINWDDYDTDKGPAYMERYVREFGDMFDKPIKLLELGVQRGGSLRLWRDLLPHATIVGLDLNEITIDDDTGRVHVYQGFQQDPDILDRIAAEHAPDGFDVIIDDASHIGRYTAESFWHLFPRHLKPGGVYVIDDWSCAYLPEWTDGRAYAGSREALGDFRGVQPLSEVGRTETLRRRVRQAARPLAAKLNPAARARLERLYMRAEGATIQKKFPSHEYGMAGFVKQLVDASSTQSIDRDSVHPHDPQIRSLHVSQSQVFVHKGSKTLH